MVSFLKKDSFDGIRLRISGECTEFVEVYQVMRCLYPVILAAVIPSSGCSCFLICSGKDLGVLATQEEVQKDFGSPVACGEEDGKSYEEFRTHQKISESWKQEYYLLGFAVTFGLGEVIWFPTEVYKATHRSIMGQTIRFVYDSQGYVKDVRLDGDYYMIHNHGAATDP